jgi:hypothetical protein
MVTLWNLTWLNHSLSADCYLFFVVSFSFHEWFYDAQFAFVNKNIRLRILVDVLRLIR